MKADGTDGRGRLVPMENERWRGVEKSSRAGGAGKRWRLRGERMEERRASVVQFTPVRPPMPSILELFQVNFSLFNTNTYLFYTADKSLLFCKLKQ